MTEPRRRAKRKPKITEDILRFSVHDDRIDYESDCYAVRTARGTILIDPLPLREKDLKLLAPIQAILLTASCHQRSAWRYRKRFGVKVYAPHKAQNLEEKADIFYNPGRRLPGDLIAVHAPGPTDAHYAFLLQKITGCDFLCRSAKPRARGAFGLHSRRISG